jgi:hypothetical protein
MQREYRLLFQGSNEPVDIVVKDVYGNEDAENDRNDFQGFVPDRKCKGNGNKTEDKVTGDEKIFDGFVVPIMDQFLD